MASNWRQGLSSRSVRSWPLRERSVAAWPGKRGRPSAMALSGRTVGLTAVAMVAFAANSLLCRAALADGYSDATTFTTFRVVGGALSLGLLVRSRGGRSAGATGGWTSATALFVYAIAFSLAYLHIPAGTGALLLIAAVQITMICGGLLAGERPKAREWVGLALSLAGLVVLTRPGLAQPDPVGAALMIAAGVAWGLYSLRGRGAGDALSVNAVNFVRAVPLAVVGSVVGLAVSEPHLTPTGVTLALVSGAITSGLGYAVWYAALRGLSATQGAIVQLSVPPLAALGGVWLLDEALTSRLLVAGLLILGGIALAIGDRRRRG
jgi:drug/metabolite transporter (DMT)-like permease